MVQKLSNELYEPPEVTLCLVQVELGFYGSGGGGSGYPSGPSSTTGYPSGDIGTWDEGDPGYWL